MLGCTLCQEEDEGVVDEDDADVCDLSSAAFPSLVALLRRRRAAFRCGGVSVGDVADEEMFCILGTPRWDRLVTLHGCSDLREDGLGVLIGLP